MNDTTGAGRGPARYSNGRFGPGNPGRPKSSRNRQGGQIADALLAHFLANQDEMLEKLTRFFFPEYVRLLARLLPRGPAADDDCLDLDDLPPEAAADLLADATRLLGQIKAGEAQLSDLADLLAEGPAADRCADSTVN
jgi:hypothetical protein